MSFERHLSDGAVFDSAFFREPLTVARRSTKPARSGRRLPWLVFLAGAGALAGIVIARGRSEAVALPPTSAPIAQISFTTDDRLAPMINFFLGDGERAQAHYTARSRGAGGERWDTLTSGEAEGDDLFFRVTIRSGNAPIARPSLFVALAKQASELGAAVVHATNPQPDQTTALGAIEWADITLSIGNKERSCFGFRSARLGTADVSGFACGRPGAPWDRAALECLIDRIGVTDAGEQAGLGEMAKRDATRRTACPRRVVG
jgi:hypothetical protein